PPVAPSDAASSAGAGPDVSVSGTSARVGFAVAFSRLKVALGATAAHPASSEDVTATTVVATTTSASLPRRRDDTCSIVVLLPCGPYGTARQTTPGAPFADRENRVIRNLRRSGGDSRDFAE